MKKKLALIFILNLLLGIFLAKHARAEETTFLYQLESCSQNFGSGNFVESLLGKGIEMQVVNVDVFNLSSTSSDLRWHLEENYSTEIVKDTMAYKYQTNHSSKFQWLLHIQEKSSALGSNFRPLIQRFHEAILEFEGNKLKVSGA